MKTRSQKLISLVLVLMMLVTMIPAGILGASAVSAELDAALADYENATEFVINSVEDWEAVAASGKDFAGKTVKLGADIDTAGATLTTLASSFAGNFDGQGFTISNATVTGAGVIAATLTVADADVTIGNVKFVGVTLTSTGSAGLIAGDVAITGAATVTVSKVNIDSTTSVTGAGAAAGLLGSVSMKSGKNTLHITGIDTEATITGTGATDAVHSPGGLIGYLLLDTAASATANQTILVENSYVKGAVTSSANISAAGLIGYKKQGNYQSHMEFNNVFVGVTVTTTARYKTTMFNAGQGGNLTYTNFGYTVAMNWCYINANGYKLHGESVGGGEFNHANARQTDIFKTTVGFVNGVLIKDENGFYDGAVDVTGTMYESVSKNYASTSEFVVKTAEDWNAISVSGQAFTGKTVKLGNDIDFGGATIAPLFEGYNFYGTFNGQGYTIKNAKVVRNGDAGLLAVNLDGGVVTNVNIDNVSVTTTSATGRAGILAGYNSLWANLAVSKINVTNSTVNSTGTGSTGFLFGAHNNNGFTYTVDKINLQGTVNASGAANVGGVVGEANIKSGTTTWTNIATDVDVVTNKTTSAATLGGFAGTYSVSEGLGANISNVYIGGSITDENVSAAAHAGFVGKFLGVAGVDMAGVNNIVLAVDLTAMCGNSITFAGVYNGNLVYSDVYSVTKSNSGTWSGSTQRWTGMGHNTSSFHNGTYSPWAAGDPIQNSLTYISKIRAYAMVTRDVDGFMSGISAAELTGLAAELEAYTATEYVVDSLDDWKLVGISGLDFNGKTVKLGADIDFGGKTAPVLFTAASFYGTLDGQGYTVKNAVVNEAGNAGLFSAKMGGGKITNVNIDNVTVNGNGYVGLVVGNSSVYANLEISKINATNITLNNAGTATGGIIGLIKNTGFAAVFSQIDISGTINHTTTVGNVGGIFGDGSFSNAEVGTTDFYKIKVAMDITVVTKSKVGGFGGNHLSKTNAYFTVEDVYVGGSINDNATNSHSSAAFIGWMAGTAGVTNGEATNVILNVDMSKAGGNSTVLGTVENGNFVYSNIYSVNKSNGGVHSMQAIRWTGMSYNGNSLFNGVQAAWATADPIQNSLTYVNATAAPLMIKKGADGFVDGVYTTTISALQNSAVSGDRYAVRFIAFDFMGDAENVSMNVIARVQGGVAKSFTAACTMYTGLTAYHAQGITKTYKPGDYGAQMIAGFTIYNIPASAQIDYTVTVTYTTAAGTFSNVMTVSFDADGELIQ